MNSRPAPLLPVSAVVLVQGREEDLPGCLASLRWARQTLVVRGSGAGGSAVLAAQKRCAQPWILTLEACERAAPDLEASLRALFHAGADRDAYTVRVVSEFAGRWLRHGGSYPAERVGLRRKRPSARGAAAPSAGVPGRLEGHVIRRATANLELALEQVRRESADAVGGGAGDGPAQGGAAPKGAAAVFLGAYVLNSGWRDGIQGLLYCALRGYYTFFLNLKIWEQRRKGSARPAKQA